MPSPPTSSTPWPRQLRTSSSETGAASGESAIRLPLEQLRGGAGGIELAPHDAFQQRCGLRVVGRSRLHAAAHARGSDAEHLAAQVAGAALLQGALGLD